MKPSEAVHEFHTKFGIRKAHPSDADSILFRLRLIMEEFEEVIEATGFVIKAHDPYTGEMWAPPNLVVDGPYWNQDGQDNAHVLKELADLAYVLYGTAEALGWNLDEAVRRVHESNMSKLGADGKPIYREDGKVLKGPNYKEPYLGDLV